MANSATFVKFDYTTKGSWVGVYGADGGYVFQDSGSAPSYGSVSLVNVNYYTWSTVSPQSLQKWSNHSSTINGGIYNDSNNMQLNVSITDGNQHQIALYCFDTDNYNRRWRIDVYDNDANTLIETRYFWNLYDRPVYACWNIKGNISFRFVATDSTSRAICSGYFFDSSGTPVTGGTCTHTGDDTTTQGNWIGLYGTDGYDVAGQTSSIPGYLNYFGIQYYALYVGPSGSNPNLQVPGGGSYTISEWYGSGTGGANIFDFDLSHASKIGLYQYDNSLTGRENTITVYIDGAVAFTFNEASIGASPCYSQFSMTGRVQVVVTALSGYSMVNGVFWDPASTNQTVDPNALATRQALGTVFIPISQIGPSAAPSRQAFGTVAVTGGLVTVSPATIPTPRAVGNPNVAGPTHPGAVSSQQAFGSPVLNAFQTLDPTSISSEQSLGTVAVFFVKIVNPTALATRQSLGTPAVAGGVSNLLPFTILSRQSFGFPAMTGSYDSTLTVYVGGVKWGGTVLALGGTDSGAPTNYGSQNPPTINSQTLGRWTLNIDLMDTTGANAPALGQTIELVEGGLKLFVGCIQTAGRQLLMGTSGTIIYHVLATDKSGICDRRVVKAVTYPAGNDVAATILNIVQNSLNGEGILTNTTSVPQDGSLGTLTAALTFNYDKVTAAFNQLATLTGTVWYVDYNGLLWFKPFSSLPAAPWGLTDTSNNYRALLVEETNIDYANIIYAVSNLNVLPGSGSGGSGGAGSGVGSNTETFTLTDGKLGVIFYTSPINGQRYPVGVNASLPIGTLYSVKVNGVTQNQIVAINEFNGQTPTSAPQYGPWLWLNPAIPINGQIQQFGATGISASLLGPSGLPVGATVVINYTPFTTNTQATLGSALTPVNPATGGTLGTCGSGIYELAIQVKDVSTVADLNAISAAELAKRNGLPVKITFQTDKPGLFPGQLLNVNCPSVYLNNKNFLIISARGVAASGVLEYGSRFQWEIQAQSNEDPGNWYQYFANVIKQSANGLPVYQYESANFVLGSGSSISGGTPALNPYQVKRTGQLVNMFAAAGTPPTGQDLIIQFLVNGLTIPGTIKIPGGSAANTSYVVSFSLSNPLYVFNTSTEADIVTVSLSYSVTGANPTPAANVSATLRWRI